MGPLFAQPLHVLTPHISDFPGHFSSNLLPFDEKGFFYTNTFVVS